MRRKVLLPEWLKGTVSCRHPRRARHCLCSGSWPLAVVSGAYQQSRETHHLLERWLLRHVGLVCERTCAITQVPKAKLAMKCCVLPPETLSTQDEHCSTHSPWKSHRQQLPVCLQSCPSTGLQAFLVLHRAGQLKKVPWLSSTKRQFHLSLRWLRGTWLLKTPVPWDIKVLLIHRKQTLSLHQWNDAGATTTPVVWKFRN